jgi:hypothetical protein
MNRVPQQTKHKRLLNQTGEKVLEKKVLEKKVVEKKVDEKVFKKNDSVTKKNTEICIKKIQEKDPTYNQFTVLG